MYMSIRYNLQNRPVFIAILNTITKVNTVTLAIWQEHNMNQRMFISLIMHCCLVHHVACLHFGIEKIDP